MSRLLFVLAVFPLSALGCASSVPVECPQDSIECEPGPVIRMEDGGTTDSGPMPDASTCNDAECDDGNACTIDACDGDACASSPAEDGTACVFQDGAGVCEAGACTRDCEIEDCREVYPCTEEGLREAVDDGGDIVIGCNGPTTVLLTEGQLDMFKDVSIDGLGLLTVDAQGLSRVFAAHEEVSAELIGMDITGGNAGTAEESHGGGIHTSGYTNVTLRNCRVYGNAALSAGGGIRAAGNLTLQGCEVYSNTAGGAGGGLALWRESRVVNSVVADNQTATKGGGIYGTAEKALVIVEDSVVERNQAMESGGGIWCSGTTILDGAIIRNNVAVDVGGGVRVYGTGATRPGTLTTRHLTQIVDNTAKLGGGIAAFELHPEVITISDTTFAGNSAIGSSGGAIFADRSNLQVNDSVFEGNRAVNAAGAVYTKNMEAVFRRSTFSDHQARVGGAFRIRGNTSPRMDARFENCTITQSHATELGGAFFNGDATTVLLHTTLTDSTAGDAGSAFHLTDAELHAQHSVLAGGCIADPDSSLVSLGYNAILTPDTEQCTLGSFDGMETHDLALTLEQIGLAPLADNGGKTQTQMPDAGGALIDAIPAESCRLEVADDQRGEPRNGDGACDIGAVEVQPGE